MSKYEDGLFIDIRTMKAKVGYILEKYPETRNSDKELVTRIAGQFQLDPLTIYESVRRSRQQYNEKGEFLPTLEEVAKQRKLNMDVWRAALGYHGKLF